MISQTGKVHSLWSEIMHRMCDYMNDDDIDPEIQVALLLSDKNHPIWKAILGLLALLTALWMNSTV